MTEQTETAKGETPETAAETAEPVVVPAAEAATPASEPEQEPFDKSRAMATINKLREAEKQAKKELKELETLRAEKQQREEAEMTESQRLQKQVEEFKAQNAQLQANIWRNAAATEANLPSIFAERIQGATLEEMQADAKKLAEALPKQKSMPTISPTNPANGNKPETEAQARERLFGKQTNVFDLSEIERAGGGVVWVKQPGETIQE